jgi:hypothetical protein
MKTLALALAIALAVVGGTIAVSTFSSTPVAACNKPNGC